MTGSQIGRSANDGNPHQFEVALDFDVDLINMIFFDQFLADNFIRCFFRYYPKLSEYVKDVFKEGYHE
jgi:hypothetical protein